MTHTVNIVLSRSTDQRTWIATIVGNGRAVGLGPTPGKAVEELFRWSRITEAAAAPPQPQGD